MIGVNITHIPYRGTGPAMQDLIGGRIDYICEVVTTIKSQLDGGTIKGLAMLDSKRSKALPDLPTAEEQGTKDLIAYTWNAIFLPKNAPEAIVNKLNGAMLQAMHAPEVKDKLSSLGAEIVAGQSGQPVGAGQAVKDETEKWAVPIKASGVSVE